MPSSRTIVATPWKKPLKRGVALLNMSSMSLILIVSCGVVTKIASHVPAPRPARKPFALPSSFGSMFENASLLEKRIAALGVAK